MKCEICHKFLKEANQFHKCLATVLVQDKNGNKLAEVKTTKFISGIRRAGRIVNAGHKKTTMQTATVVITLGEMKVREN